MGYKRLGYTNYGEYLGSDWFGKVKHKAYKRSGGKCTICGKRFNLEAHHLTYTSLGHWWEYLAVRYLCRSHHKMCSYIFWFFKVPNVWYWMIPRYYFVKFRYIILRFPVAIPSYIWYNYRINGKFE